MKRSLYRWLMDRYRRKVLLAALEKCGYNRKATARLLGVNLATVCCLCRKYEIVCPDFRGKHKAKGYSAASLVELLERNGWNQSKVAKQLGVSHQRVGQLVKKYGIEMPDAAASRASSRNSTARRNSHRAASC
jgi:transcriptional regulator with GAF, ATPase, and Fis domain